MLKLRNAQKVFRKIKNNSIHEVVKVYISINTYRSVKSVIHVYSAMFEIYFHWYITGQFCLPLMPEIEFSFRD